MYRPIKFKNFISAPDDKYVWLLFILWPFSAFVFAIKNYRHTLAKNIIWLFIIFYGYSMVISGDAENGADATRYRDSFIEMSDKQYSSLDFNKLFYNEESEGALDILQPLLMILISRVTNNYHLLFAAFGLVFGFFYSRNIWFLIEHAGRKIKSVNLPILITFALIVGFWNINGFRFWTATHFFIYGALRYLISGKKMGLGIMLLSPLVHFSFLFPVGILLAYILIGNRKMIYFYFYLGTLFMSAINLEVINNLLTNYTPSIFHKRINSYANQDYADRLGKAVEQTNWYVQFNGVALRYVILLLIIVIYYKGNKFISKHKNLDNLFCFSLFFSGMANISSMMPSGGRFLSVGYLLMVPLIFWYVQYAPKEQLMKRLIPFAIPALSLFCIVAIRVSFDTIGLLTVFGNPIVAPFVNIDLPLINIIKKIL